MTISAAFQHAMAGLRVAGRATEVIATNISNANTPGYARRVLEQSSANLTNVGGVIVSGVVRSVDPGILSARRSAQADLGYAEGIKQFSQTLETALGTPDDPRAITNLLADFESSLLSAASRPDANERLSASVSAAKQVVNVINDASRTVSEMRSNADQAIEAQVTRLNAALKEVEYLNTQIAQVNIGGQDSSALKDLRQNVIDEIHEIIPVHEAGRDNGKIALYSEGGVILIDGPAAEIEFDSTRQVTPYMTFDGGQLSGLSVNGNQIRTIASNSSIPGGTLAAQFAVRDELGEDALTQLDAVARNLMERFEDPTVDPTLSPGDPGLFTDAGIAFDALNEIGLAERLSINAAVDPDQGGEVWRLRDGLGAATPGEVGQATILQGLRDLLNDRTVPNSGDFGSGSLSMTDVANGLMGRIGVQRLSADQSVSFAAAAFHETSQAERASGVDTDAELQQLILVEQNYAANARMIETINEMMDTLMRIGA